MNRINHKLRLNIENFEDRSVPSASPLYQDVFIPDLSAGEPVAQTREHILLARQVGVPSATDAPMPQTREHILLARQVGVSTASNQGWGSWEVNATIDPEGIGADGTQTLQNGVSTAAFVHVKAFSGIENGATAVDSFYGRGVLKVVDATGDPAADNVWRGPVILSTND